MACSGAVGQQRLRVAVTGAMLVLLACVCGPAPARAASVCPNESLRSTLSRALSDCRAYEMVSPLDKNGGSVDRDVAEQGFSTTGASTSGDAVAYSAAAQFAGNASGSPFGQYRGVRTASGWDSRGIDPPLLPEGPTNTPSIQLFSTDLARVIVTTNASLAPGAEEALGGSRGLYRRDDSGGSTSYLLLSSPFAPLSTVDVGNTLSLAQARFSAAAGSDDLGHVVFNSLARQLTADGPVPDDGQPSDNMAVYEWINGQLRFVSVLPNGQPAPNAVAGGRDSHTLYPGDHLLSNDGRRVYFTAGAVPGPARPGLYVREDGSSTKHVSESERDGHDPSATTSGVFQAAKADDGSLALFISPEKLTNDAKAGGPADDSGRTDLYLWDATAPEGARLTDLTTGDDAGGGVLGTAGVSDDLSHVYFVATSVLASDATASDATDGSPNLYLWTPAGGIHLVATLNGDPGVEGLKDEGVWSVNRRRASLDTPAYRDARVTADGSRLAFVSSSQLTSYDNAGHKEVYLYDAVADQLTCVSCSPLSSTASVDAELFPIGQNLSNGGLVHTPYRLPRNLSGSGRQVFFETAQKLVPGDSNGLADVYEWNDGQLSLISTGQGELGAQFIDASNDGRDVFFTTRERLVGADIDDQVDIYDARIGGGFPEPVAPVPCVADDCQGPLSTPPALTLPATGALQGAGNVAQPKAKKAKKCRKGFVKKRVHGKAKCVKKPRKHARRGRR